ncbi:MAG: sulfite exporter TauE/SafE family protein [Deferrisomatales bacterium]|nr:sulfite exporter TauE/SafE family protein [Deferrisomatales bacterium]
MSLEYWYVLPVSVVIAATAMASGVGGATFFAPFFIIGLGLPPEVAIGTGLITEVFGFASGVYAYSRRKLIDFRLGSSLLVATVPAALLGSWVAGSISPEILKVILGTGLFAVALSFLRTPDASEVGRLDAAIDRNYGAERAETCLESAAGEKICYTVCNRLEGRTIAGVGGLFVGMISTGLGELNGYFLLRRCRVPSRVSVATSVFVVAVTALSAAAGHLFQFVRSGPEVLATVGSLILFTVPGVVLGAQLGSELASRISQHSLERAMGLLFLGVGALTLGEVLF